MTDINNLSDRLAMNLPEYLTPSNGDYSYIEKYLPDNLKNDLANIILKKNSAFSERLSAGTLLGLLGDKRIRTLSPDMIFIPGGVVKLGLDYLSVDEVMHNIPKDVKRSWIEKECPSFTKVIDPFNIGKYPVTNAEYRDFLLDTKLPMLPKNWHLGAYPFTLSNHPVCYISHEWTLAYCQWLSDKTGRDFRLPEEWEWEFAASGPQNHAYPWGDSYQAGMANTLEEKVNSTTPVGIFPDGVSVFGVSDMAGNVEEFTATHYFPYPGGEIIQDDLYLDNPEYPIARGGSFARSHDLARCKRRHGYFDKPIYAIGFRLAESIKTLS